MKTLTIPIMLTAFAVAACQPLLAPDTPDQIPQVMQGRWGLTENDCDPTRDDNKGLMVVGPDTLRFYEARATLTQITGGDSTRLQADYAFTGEGQSWTRQITFESQDGGMILLRTDQGDGATGDTYRYLDCEAV
ncbi:hypothetical protein [Pseudooceanicola onchidii]|uniref:hypothetical protein n=1 Tax=Pseudooceanicola onchidii TaxID=2562279 RepID=UPI0010AA8289|nr:hypothetical protein [Pseudooceanicola onchidii]